jgi:hypothetical protein
MPARYPSAECTDTSETRKARETGKARDIMDMTESRVLCAASAYEQKYYFNKAFDRIPDDIKDQLHIICVLFTEDIGGIILFEFDEEGHLCIRTEAAASDYNYDEIGAALEVKEIQRQRRDMLNGLELYYRAVILGQPLDLEDWQLE